MTTPSDSGPAATGSWSPRLPDELKDAQDPASLIGLRERFSLAEAVRVLSHYDLGVIERVREYRRGSRRSPKMRITTDTGEYLVKRRAPGRDDRGRIEFVHDLQADLRRAGYPVAELIGAKVDGATMVSIEERCYEVFRFVESSGFPATPAATESAGRRLAEMHVVTGRLRTPGENEFGSFHGAHGTEATLNMIPDAVAAVETDVDPTELRRTCKLLRKGYAEAARRAEAAGLEAMPPLVNHGDWHPGNLLYDGDAVVGVIDFDSARPEPRVVDVANGLLQFTMLMAEPMDPSSWPDGFDPPRIESFLHGYDDVSAESPAGRLGSAEMAALPWLMIEALIMESIVPIAATGAFASIRGSSFLQMVERKVDWIWRRSSRLKRLLS